MQILNQEIKEYIHPSGLCVYYLLDEKTEEFSANLSVDYGSLIKNDIAIAGSAHFLEHIMFHKKEGDFMKDFDMMSASSNAYTTYDHTTYKFSSTGNFKDPLNKLFDLVNSFLATEKSILKEHDIIAEELKMYSQMPSEIIRNTHYNNICKNSNYRFDIGGDLTSIKKLDFDKLSTIYQTYYKPSNQKLFLCGNVSFDEIISVVNQFYDQFDKIDKPIIKYEKEEFNPSNTIIETNKNFNTNITKISYPIVKEVDIDTYLTIKSNINVVINQFNDYYNDKILTLKLNNSFKASINVNHSYSSIDFSMVGVNDLDEFSDVSQELLKQILESRDTILGFKKEVASIIRQLDNSHDFMEYFLYISYSKLNYKEYINKLLSNNLNIKDISDIIGENKFTTHIIKEEK